MNLKHSPNDSDLSLANCGQVDSFRWNPTFPLLIATILLVCAATSTAFDISIAQSVGAGNLPGDVSRTLDVSEFFAHGFGMLVIASAVWILLPEQKRYVPRILACAFGAGLVANLIKSCIGRFRPVAYLNEYPETVDQTFCGSFLAFNSGPAIEWSHPVQSFPSAHAATAFGLAMALTWLFPRGRYLFFFLAILASAQRVVSLAHWTSDVFIGAAVGIVIAETLLRSQIGNLMFARIENPERKTEIQEPVSIRRAA